MNYFDYFKSELSDSKTQYFIIDTHDSGGDRDFVKYEWETNKYNLVNAGDLFLYRRPQRASEIPGEFYFFGAGKFDNIKKVVDSKVVCDISKPYYFDNYVLKRDLISFNWLFKKKKNSSWEHFFNQYGMNKVTKEDFLGILNHSVSSETIEENTESDLEVEKKLYLDQQQNNFEVEDKVDSVKIRGAAQKVFGNKVKANYGYKCAITQLSNKEFLVASHIIPWAIDKKNRINPRNGICLSTLLDKAFDKGYISFTDEYRLIISNEAQKDVILFELLKPYNNVKLVVPIDFAPDVDFLKWHRENIFKA